MPCSCSGRRRAPPSCRCSAHSGSTSCVALSRARWSRVGCRSTTARSSRPITSSARRRRRAPGAGLPTDRAGFCRSIATARSRARTAVYAAGEVTSFPLRQGGLAAQQADVVAGAIAARCGLRRAAGAVRARSARAPDDERRAAVLPGPRVRPERRVAPGAVVAAREDRGTLRRAVPATRGRGGSGRRGSASACPRTPPTAGAPRTTPSRSRSRSRPPSRAVRATAARCRHSTRPRRWTRTGTMPPTRSCARCSASPCARRVTMLRGAVQCRFAVVRSAAIHRRSCVTNSSPRASFAQAVAACFGDRRERADLVACRVTDAFVDGLPRAGRRGRRGARASRWTVKPSGFIRLISSKTRDVLVGVQTKPAVGAPRGLQQAGLLVVGATVRSESPTRSASCPIEASRRRSWRHLAQPTGQVTLTFM